MGAPQSVKPRIVFDTNVLVSALVFRNGRLAVLREYWRMACTPLVSNTTAAELMRVLSYAHFKLSKEAIAEALALYLPYCERIDTIRRNPLKCRDPNDQMFLDLAGSGDADLLVSGDQDLLVLRERAKFKIISPAEYLAESA